MDFWRKNMRWFVRKFWKSFFSKFMAKLALIFMRMMLLKINESIQDNQDNPFQFFNKKKTDGKTFLFVLSGKRKRKLFTQCLNELCRTILKRHIFMRFLWLQEDIPPSTSWSKRKKKLSRFDDYRENSRDSPVADVPFDLEDIWQLWLWNL